MKIAIIEICFTNHYTLVNTLIKTYACDSKNQIIVFTTKEIEKTLQETGVPQNTRFELFDVQKEPAEQFLKNIEKQVFDRLHITTIKKHFDEFVAFQPQTGMLFLHIHNIDLWFEHSLSSNIRNLVATIQKVPDKAREIARFFRDILKRNRIKRTIIYNFQKYNFRLIVFSSGQVHYLEQFIDPRSIMIFPSDICEKEDFNPLVQTQNDTIRICIPGSVTDTRRDYTGFLNMLESILPQIKGKLVFDFLGYVDKLEPQLLQKIKKINALSLEIHHYEDFITAQAFDEGLEKADILLNNQIINYSHTGKYGVSKESGFLFKMLRGARPGIMPAGYSVDKEFEGTLLFFSDNNALKNIILRLANREIALDGLKEKAYEMSKLNTPKNLYKKLLEIPELVV
jgi:hypothetical protein